jgi:uncharacterized protein (UPF0276 family)
MISSVAVGIGLRQPHYAEVFERRPALGFLEVHSENFFLDGGASMRVLERARAAYPISLHGVGLSLGSADALAERHLAKLLRLVERIEPELVSEHLSWGGVGGRHFNDLLPLPSTREVLDLMSARVDRVQSLLRRPILIENVSAYVAYCGSEMSEFALLGELTRRTGCRLLLDLNNLYVNAVNFGVDLQAALNELTPQMIGEIHLAGHTSTDAGLIDTHGTRVCPDVWSLYAAACQQLGPHPTLIEWDTDLPALDVLLDEAGIAASVAARSEMAHA